RLRRLRVAAGFAAVELSFTLVSGRRAVGKSALVCPIFPGLLSSLLASESKPSSKALAARCAALAPRAPTTRTERLETSSFLIRCGCMVRSKAIDRTVRSTYVWGSVLSTIFLTERFGHKKMIGTHIGAPSRH